MAVVVKVDRARKLVCTTFSGEINEEELLRPLSLIPAQPGFDPSFSDLVDFSEVTRAGISTPALRKLSESQSLFQSTSKHAIVAPRDFAFGLARMFQTMADQTRPNLLVVRTLAEAYSFLGIAPVKEPPVKEPKESSA